MSPHHIFYISDPQATVLQNTTVRIFVLWFLSNLRLKLALIEITGENVTLLII